MKNFIFLIVFTALISKFSCKNIKPELQVINGSNIVSQQINLHHGSNLMSRMKESIDSDYPKVIIYIPTNDEPLELKQSPLKHMRNFLLSFFDGLIKKEMDIDDDFSNPSEAKRQDKVQVVSENKTDEVPPNTITQTFEEFTSNLVNNLLSENDAVEDGKKRCISCQYGLPYDKNTHSCRNAPPPFPDDVVEEKLQTTNSSEKLQNSSETTVLFKILPVLKVDFNNEAPVATKQLEKRENPVPENKTSKSSTTDDDDDSHRTEEKVIQSTEQFLTELIDNNTKYFFGETNNEVTEEIITKKLGKTEEVTQTKLPVEETPETTSKNDDKILNMEPMRQTANDSSTNSTNKFLDTHHFLLNSGGTANHSATAAIIKNKIINLKNKIGKILLNEETQVEIRTNSGVDRLKRHSPAENKKSEDDDDDKKHIMFISKPGGVRSERKIVPKQKSSLRSDSDENSPNTAPTAKPLLMIITVPTFLGIGALILVCCFLTRDGGWCCKLFNIQYYKDQEENTDE